MYNFEYSYPCPSGWRI